MQTLIEALQQAKKEGYKQDFNLDFIKKDFTREKLEEKIIDFCSNHRIDKVFRVDEETDPADQSVVYAISSDDGKAKGVLVNGYGPYSDSTVNKVVEHLDPAKVHQTKKDTKSGIVSYDTWVF